MKWKVSGDYFAFTLADIVPKGSAVGVKSERLVGGCVVQNADTLDVGGQVLVDGDCLYDLGEGVFAAHLNHLIAARSVGNG